MTYNHAIIYTMDKCPYCVNAKLLLQKHKIGFAERKNPSRVDVINALHGIKRFDGVEMNISKDTRITLPQIWLMREDGSSTYVGGFDELRKFINEGGLKEDT